MCWLANLTTRSKINTRINSLKKNPGINIGKEQKTKKKKKNKKKHPHQEFFHPHCKFYNASEYLHDKYYTLSRCILWRELPPDFTSFQSTDITNVKLFQNLEIVPQKNFCPSIVHAEIKVHLLTPSPLLTPPLMNCHSFISKPAVNG